jgi:hypothetical protein
MMPTLVLLLALLATTAPLAAQDPRLTARFAPTDARMLTAVIDSAAAIGLPREPLILRALEGAAKGVPTARIRQVLARQREAMHDARDLIGADADPTELATAATALQQGVPRAHLAELRAWRRDRSITVPLGAYLDLMARGTSSDRAWDQVAALARRNAADREFVRLIPPSGARP